MKINEAAKHRASTLVKETALHKNNLDLELKALLKSQQEIFRLFRNMGDYQTARQINKNIKALQQIIRLKDSILPIVLEDIDEANYKQKRSSIHTRSFIENIIKNANEGKPNEEQKRSES